MPVVASFDGPNRRIFLDASTVNSDWSPVDIYREYRALRRTNESFRVWEPFMRYVGNEPKGGGKATPRYLLLLLGAKIVPYNSAGYTEATGEILTDDQSDPFDVGSLTEPIVVKYAPADAEIVYKEIPSPIQDRLDYADQIIVDPSSGYSGTTHPVGTAAQPVNNMADAITLAGAYDINRYRIRGHVTVTQDVSNSSFLSDHKNGRITVSTLANVNQCLFERLDLDGDFNNAEIEAIRCIVGNCNDVQGELYHCGLSGTVLIAAYGTLTLDGCTSRIPGINTPIIDMNSGVDTQLNGRALSTGLTIKNCDTANSEATFEFVAGKITIDSNCTAGYISVRDAMQLINNTGGTTVDYFATAAKTVWDSLPTQLAILENANPQQIAELVVERLLGTTTFPEV